MDLFPFQGSSDGLLQIDAWSCAASCCGNGFCSAHGKGSGRVDVCLPVIGAYVPASREC